jgi:membrane dipeptidase
MNPSRVPGSLAAIAAIVAMSALTAAPLAAQDDAMERVRKLLTITPLIDGHNDLPWAIRQSETAPKDVAAYDLRKRTAGHTDIERLRQGMVGAQFWSVYIPSSSVETGAAKMQLEQIDIALQVIARYPDVFELARTASDVERIFGSGKIASLLGMEGGHAIENSLGALRAFYEMGARYMTLTHSANIDWADAGTDTALHNGLTGFGEEVVREMNRLGMLVDLSHTSPATMSDVLNVTRAPVIFSHSSARGVTDHARNVPDSILTRLKSNGGVVMVTFVPQFISNAIRDWDAAQSARRAELTRQFPRDTARVMRDLRAWRQANPVPSSTMADVIAHIEQVRKIAGINNVGIGGDYDGISSTPEGMDDVSSYPALFAELARRGWSDDDLKKLAGENVLRVMRRAEEVSRIMQREGAMPSNAQPALPE